MFIIVKVMANYCKNLWIKYGELQGAHQNCATILDLAKAKGKSQFADLDAALSDAEAKLTEMQEQWENSFVEFRPGEKIFLGEYEALKQLEEENPGLSLEILKQESWRLKVEKGVVIQLILADIFFMVDLRSIKPLVNLRHLKMLDLSEAEIDEFEALANLPRLESLCLNYTNCKNFTFLKNMKSLKILLLDDTSISNSDIPTLESLVNLERITLSHADITKSDWLKSLPNLKTLVVGSMDEFDFSNIADLKNLEELDLSGNSDLNTNELSSNSEKLTKLTLEDCSLSDINFLSSLKSLVNLNLAKNPIADFSPFNGMSFDELDLSDTNLENLESITHIKSLRSLNIRNTNVFDLEPLTRSCEQQSLQTIRLPDAFKKIDQNDPQKKYLDHLLSKGILINYY